MKYLVALRTKDGVAICPASVIDGRSIPERRYPIRDYVVTLDTQPEPVLTYDYMLLLSTGNGAYRPMTPSEQNALRKRQEQANTVEE